MTNKITAAILYKAYIHESKYHLHDRSSRDGVLGWQDADAFNSLAARDAAFKCPNIFDQKYCRGDKYRYTSKYKIKYFGGFEGFSINYARLDETRQKEIMEVIRDFKLHDGKFGFAAAYWEGHRGQNGLPKLGRKVFNNAKGEYITPHDNSKLKVVEMTLAGKDEPSMAFTTQAQFIIYYDHLDNVAGDIIKELNMGKHEMMTDSGEVRIQYGRDGKPVSKFDAYLAVQLRHFYRERGVTLSEEEFMKMENEGIIPLKLLNIKTDTTKAQFKVYNKKTGSIEIRETQIQPSRKLVPLK